MSHQLKNTTFRVIHTWTDSDGRENSEFETYTHTHDATSALRAFIDERIAGGDSDIKGIITIETIKKGAKHGTQS